jgi:tetratricopeptide (TPR) repeat protein
MLRKGRYIINRTEKSKAQYIFLLIILLIFAFIIIVSLYRAKLQVILPIIPVIFLIPGRIQGYYYKNFFKARRLLVERDYQGSIRYNELFLDDISAHKWIKKLIWLSWGMFSKDIEAMTLNNLGSSYLYLGNFAIAESYFNEATRLDGLYPIPYYNLSILSYIQGNSKKSEELHERAVELGFKQTTFDKVIQISQQILANIEGQ